MATHVVNTHEATSRLSQLIREAEQGNEVIVARHGQPVAKIIPWPPASRTRVSGQWAGRVRYVGDLVGPDPDVLAAFDESASRDLP